MKIRIFYIAVIFSIIAISVNSQPLRLNTTKNSELNNSSTKYNSPDGYTRSTNLVHTKSINYVWSGSSWTYLSNATYKYNADGMQTELFLVDTTISLNLFMQVNYYDIHKNSTGFIYKLWDTVSHKWDTVQGQRLLYQYNASNYITQKVSQEWNNGWGNKSKEDYILGANGKYTVITVYSWVGNNWAPYFKDTLCTWQGEQLASFLEKIPITGGWRDDVKYSSVFTGGKNFISLYFTFNGSGWDSVYRFTRIFDANGGYSHVTEQYNGSAWVNAARTLYYIDSLGNYYGFRYDEWDVIGSNWSQYEGTFIAHTYNANELFLSEILSQYSTFTHKLVYKEKHVFTEFKIPPTISIRGINTSGNIKIYPNPATDRINIENTGSIHSGAAINIYDINGRQVLNRSIYKNENSVQIDLKGFTLGVYLLEVRNGNEVSRSRILIK